MPEYRQIPLIEFECADRHIRVQFSVTPVAMVKTIIGKFENDRLTIGHANVKKVRLFLRNRPTRIL